MVIILKNIPTEVTRLFRSDGTRFIISVGFKVSGISFAITVIIYWFIFQIMRLNQAFFHANGFPEFSDQSSFFDLIIQESLENLTVMFAFHIFLFFIGTYVGWLILRPFRVIGEYCEIVVDKPEAIYHIEEFSTYSLLSRFSEFFFEFLRDARKKNKIISNSIPPQYSRIHKPVFDKVFMFHFGLLLVIISISSGVFIIENTSSIFENMIDLATKSIQSM